MRYNTNSQDYKNGQRNQITSFYVVENIDKESQLVLNLTLRILKSQFILVFTEFGFLF